MRKYKAKYRYTDCKVLRVVDGDTVDLSINLGFSIFTEKRVRLWGINTSESRTRNSAEKVLGLAAKAELTGRLPVGSSCTLDSIDLGKYGRVLGVIFTEHGVNINELMLGTEGTVENYYE